MLPTDSARRSGRRKPDLSIDTSPPLRPSRSRDRIGIPHTPISSHKDGLAPAAPIIPAGGGPSGRSKADIETFLEGLTPVDVPPIDMTNPIPIEHDSPSSDPDNCPTNDRDSTDSHDLSLSPRNVTRDSLVANMLLSLDKLTLGQLDSSYGPSRSVFDEPPIYSPFHSDDRDPRSMTFASRSGRPGHQYSYSSDFDAADDSSRLSSRGRRSNSGSGFQTGIGRINSMRETSQRSPGRVLHSRGRKGSKSSSSTSIDAGYAQVLGSQRWTRGFGGRPSSFDGEPQPSPAAWQLELSNSFFNDGFDAAPTPTVPGGPRKLNNVPSLPIMPAPPPPPPPPPPEPKSELKPSSKGGSSALPRSGRSSRSSTIARKTEKFTSPREPPPIPTYDFDSAPAPHIGYEKSKDAQLSTANNTTKESKPGFFRRMFGSAKSVVPSSVSTPQLAFPSLQAKSSTPPSREGVVSAAHTLQKKTSSFFRRRKHSVTETDHPPPVPPVPPVKLPLDKPEPSPMPSLRRAMDPFLQGSSGTSAAQTPADTPLPSAENPLDTVQHQHEQTTPRRPTDDEARKPTRGFSPDYDPSPKAVIRKVDSEPVSGQGSRPVATTPHRSGLEPDVGSPPQSFLRDNSDSEDSPVRQRKTPWSESREQGLRPGPDPDILRTRTPSPVMSKSKSVPNLNRAREEARPRPGQSKRPPSVTRNDRRDSNLLDAGGETMYKPSLPSLRIESAEPSPNGMGAGESVNQSAKSIDEPEVIVGDPTEDDRQKARKIFDGIEDFISKDRAAAWMGEEGTVRQRTLRAFMELFDFEGQSIVASLRQVCERLLLRAETQQLDRILVAFSKRWCECNPNHGFKSVDVIHTICYSIMLLNTDLHMADIEKKMTRSQFVKNTMTTIRQALEDSAPEAFEKPSILPGKSALGEAEPRTSEDHKHNSFRYSFKPPPRPTSALGNMGDHAATESCGPLVKAPFDGSLRDWEEQVEIVLKNIYSSIRDDRLPLLGGAEPSPMHTPNTLSVMGMLRRSPSVLSKAPSEGVASTHRGRMPVAGPPSSSSRWNSKSRSRPRGFGTGFSSSRTSFEDSNSVWSPTESSATWSKLSLGRTHTSMSMDSFGSAYPRGEYQQSIGFANALSQAIIREDNPDDHKDDIRHDQLLEDESLELAGPPWVKEGIVVHKHHLDGIDKKAKDRNWTEVFAVIQKGQLSLFSFSPNKSLRNKGRRGPGHNNSLPKGAVVGGGNWQDNATNLGTFSLRQTLASALPPPGYSRTRPYVWALSLPTGAVHLFQVGTPEICKEFVNTVNYWSARLSTHPLTGGVSNIEYGWSDAVINSVQRTSTNDGVANRPASSTKGHSRPGSSATAAITAGRSSMQSGRSMRSASFDFPVRPGSGSSGVLGGTLPRHFTNSSNPGISSSSSGKNEGKLPGDRIHIVDWTPPPQSMRASPLSEAEQLASLEAYVRSIETELQTHNALRGPMLQAFSPRSANAAKAMANWERKSEYLLRESVKFRTYVESLRFAEQRKREVYEERERARRAARGEDVDDLDEAEKEQQKKEGEEKEDVVVDVEALREVGEYLKRVQKEEDEKKDGVVAEGGGVQVTVGSVP